MCYRSRMIRFATPVLAALFASSVAAQGMPPLPSTLQGRWTVVPPGGRTIIDSFKLRFDGAGAPGPVKGRVDWRGRGCGALDEPLAGSWDGSLLRFEFTGSSPPS